MTSKHSSPKYAAHLDGIEQAMSIKFNNLVYEMQRDGIDVIVLSLGEAFFDIPLYRFDDLPYPAIYHYSHSRGLPELRQKLSTYYQQYHCVDVDAESEMLITAGSKLAIHMAFMALLNPGDEVLIPEPAWVSYPQQVLLCHGVPKVVPCHETVQDYERYVTSRTKALVVNNPHNPRGQVFSRQEMECLYDLARRRNFYLICDEAYSDFLVDEEFCSIGSLDTLKQNSIICNSMSKNYGMSGWRVGYVITNPELTSQILKINQHLVTCPATILQHYLAHHFDEILNITKPQIAQVILKRRQVAAYMDSLGMTYLHGTGTFYLFASLGESKIGSEEFCTRLLKDHHVCAVPGIGYGASCDRYIRVSIGTEDMERTKHGVDMIQRLIRMTS